MSEVYDNLSICTNSLKEIVSSLNNTVQLMNEGNKDTNRLNQVLATKRVFGLVPDIDITDATNVYKQEMSQEIEQALGKLDRMLAESKDKKATQQRRRDRLVNKLNSMPLQGSRLSKRKTLDLLKQKKRRLQYSMANKEKERERERSRKS
ncbi:SPC19 [[Candida] subhashii]|uniref:DASH complex subunit SPC19 n=1 Tax=[Candida] subhashii TaxID=561895 RepID=A0A8J5UU16_9ASCO|nr:SPC19 [[Candida] subhashii]KAG7661310.1 SPC19 [[Candida] subhashii]